MASEINYATALDMINSYRDGLPDGSLKSVWLNHEVIDMIRNNEDVTGIRVYLAKQEDDSVTVILAPTGDNEESVHLDLGYFDFAVPCPASCDGSIGS